MAKQNLMIKNARLFSKKINVEVEEETAIPAY